MLAGADHYVHKSTEFEEIAAVRKRVQAGERVWLLGSRNEAPLTRMVATLEGVALTPREQEILAFKLRRYRNKEIAEALCISVETVKRHVTSIRRKRGQV